jgi:hypothetical protein
MTKSNQTPVTDWVEIFAGTLIAIAEASGNADKCKFARDYAHDIGRCYLEDDPLPAAFRDPLDAAAFEFKCWAWWGRGGTRRDAT